MRYLHPLLLLAVYFCATVCKSQDTQASVSISLENAMVYDAFSQIEEQTDYHFYYLDSWFSHFPKITLTKNDVPIREVLEDIFSNTEINYFITGENAIILTKNNVLYDQLPENFFPEPERQDSIPESEPKRTTTQISPIFYNEAKSQRRNWVETIYIGRESTASLARSFLLTGKVYDTISKEPIGNLALISNRAGGTVTDDSGTYSLKLPLGENLLEAKALGYLPIKKRVIIYGGGRLDFAMEENVEALDEVIVSSSARKNVEDTSMGSEEIDVREIKNIPLVLGERDIFKVATTLPGITTAGEGSAGYNVRGGKTDQNLILLDDGLLYNPSHYFGLFSAINPFTTGKVDIFKGHIPAYYGGRLSSVFDIRTKDGNMDKITAEFSIGPVTGNGMVEIPVVKKKSSVVVGVRSTYSDWILKSLDEPRLKNSRASFLDGIAKYHHNFNEKDQVKLTAYYSKDAFSITSDSLYSFNNKLISARWNHQHSTKNRSHLIFTGTQYNFDIDFDEASPRDFKYGYEMGEMELKAAHKWLLNSKLTLDGGLSTKLYQLHPGYIKPLGGNSLVSPKELQKEKALESALFIAADIKFSEKLLLDAGLRYSLYQGLGPTEQHEYAPGAPRNESTFLGSKTYGANKVFVTYQNPEVRAALRYLLNDKLSLKTSYNSSAQYVHLLSNNTTVSPIDSWKLSDANIVPQTANQFSLGVYNNFDENTFEASIEGYYKLFNNVLDYKSGASLILNDNIEQEVIQGKGKAYGVEFMLRKSRGKLNGWLSYTYSRSFNKFDSDFSEERINKGQYYPSNYDKPHDLSIVTNYKFTRRYSVSANVVYQTGRPITIPVGNYYYNNAEYLFYSNRNAYRIPDFYRLDISFNMEGNHKIKKFAHSFWNFSVYNLLGRNNPYSVFFVTEDGKVKALQSSIFSVPIPTLTYNFKF